VNLSRQSVNYEHLSISSLIIILALYRPHYEYIQIVLRYYLCPTLMPMGLWFELFIVSCCFYLLPLFYVCTALCRLIGQLIRRPVAASLTFNNQPNPLPPKNQ
jgi:hypothetical protein